MITEMNTNSDNPFEFLEYSNVNGYSFHITSLDFSDEVKKLLGEIDKEFAIDREHSIDNWQLIR